MHPLTQSTVKNVIDERAKIIRVITRRKHCGIPEQTDSWFIAMIFPP